MPSNSSALRTLTIAGLAGLVVLLAVVVVRSAWVSDDAYITMRTIDNALNGHGLRWNIAERVQSYTHPLWLILLLPIVGLSGNPYLGSIWLSLALTAYTIACVMVLLRHSPLRAVLALVVMALSKAFVEYSTSGLENALSHAVLATLMLAGSLGVVELGRLGARSPSKAPGLHDSKTPLCLGLIVSAAGLTRIDLLVLAGPIALAALRDPRRTLPPFALGFLPLLAWEVFSVVYYGVPFPNTAYAKLGTGIPSGELAAQGVVYLLDSLKRDPVTLFTILAGVLSAFGGAGRGARIPAIAIALYLVYVVRIGGDFMSGRFLTAPLLVALCLPSGIGDRLALVPRIAMIALAAAFGLTAPRPPIYSDSSYYTPLSDTVLAPSGVTDQRGEYFQRTGWRTATGWRTRPYVDDLVEKIARVKATNPGSFSHDAVGLAGYYAGPDRYIVDVYGLGDPFIARLPASRPWRIGHYFRITVDGYDPLAPEGATRIADPHFASLYNLLVTVTRDPIWSARRWRAIVALNTGRIDGWK